MKTILTWLLCFAAAAVLAQEPIVVKVEERPSSQGVQPAFEVAVPQASPREAIDLWKKTITPSKLFKKTPKMEKEKDEWQVNNVLISDIASQPLDVITQVSDFPGHIYVRIFLYNQAGFVGADSTAQTAAAKNYIRNYAVELYQQAVEKELKDEKQTLKSMEHDKKNLVRKNKSYGNKRADAEREKAELEQDAKSEKDLLDQKGVVLTTDPEGTREDLEKELKSNEKDIKKAGRAASRFKRKSRKNERAQREKESEIEKQKKKVEQVRTKLENIRRQSYKLLATSC
jgi:hypothetical protein